MGSLSLPFQGFAVASSGGTIAFIGDPMTNLSSTSSYGSSISVRSSSGSRLKGESSSSANISWLRSWSLGVLTIPCSQWISFCLALLALVDSHFGTYWCSRRLGPLVAVCSRPNMDTGPLVVLNWHCSTGTGFSSCSGIALVVVVCFFEGWVTGWSPLDGFWVHFWVEYVLGGLLVQAEECLTDSMAIVSDPIPPLQDSPTATATINLSPQ